MLHKILIGLKQNPTFGFSSTVCLTNSSLMSLDAMLTDGWFPSFTKHSTKNKKQKYFQHTKPKQKQSIIPVIKHHRLSNEEIQKL